MPNETVNKYQKAINNTTTILKNVSYFLKSNQSDKAQELLTEAIKALQMIADADDAELFTAPNSSTSLSVGAGKIEGYGAVTVSERNTLSNDDPHGLFTAPDDKATTNEQNAADDVDLFTPTTEINTVGTPERLTTADE